MKLLEPCSGYGYQKANGDGVSKNSCDIYLIAELNYHCKINAISSAGEDKIFF